MAESGYLPNSVRVPLMQSLSATAMLAPLDALRQTSRLHRSLHDVRALAVIAARTEGASWRTIATALEMPHATVAQRYRTIDPCPKQPRNRR